MARAGANMRRGDEDGVGGKGAFGADRDGAEVEALDGGWGNDREGP